VSRRPGVRWHLCDGQLDGSRLQGAEDCGLKVRTGGEGPLQHLIDIHDCRQRGVGGLRDGYLEDRDAWGSELRVFGGGWA
jgi:hypothetical protein